MRLLKFLSVLLISAFTFFVAPGIKGLRAEEPQILHVSEPVDQLPSLLELMELTKKPVEAPKVECQSNPKLKTDRCVPKYRLSADINEDSTKPAIAWIEAANKAGADELLLEINTDGGEVPSGFELARAIEESDAPVTCVIDGNAISMGFYILQSCEKRVMTRRSRLMAHEPSWAFGASGHPNDWKAYADNLKTLADTFGYWCAHRLKVSLKEYHARVDGNQQWWLEADAAKKVGAVDEIIDTVKALHKQLLHKK